MAPPCPFRHSECQRNSTLRWWASPTWCRRRSSPNLRLGEAWGGRGVSAPCDDRATRGYKRTTRTVRCGRPHDDACHRARCCQEDRPSWREARGAGVVAMASAAGSCCRGGGITPDQDEQTSFLRSRFDSWGCTQLVHNMFACRLAASAMRLVVNRTGSEKGRKTKKREGEFNPLNAWL